MQVLVTTVKSLLLVDTETGTYQPVHRGAGSYYGLAAQDGWVYVAHDARGGTISMFNNKLELHSVAERKLPLPAVHEIGISDGKVWATITNQNAVAICGPTKWEKWYPLGNTNGDMNHFNSLHFDDNFVRVLAHNKGERPSEILTFKKSDFSLDSRLAIGMRAHNIRWYRDQWVVCSSGEGRLLGSNGFEVSVGDFPRGLVISEAENVVGVSRIAPRADRPHTTSSLYVYDADWQKKKEIDLVGEGDVHDVMRVDALVSPPVVSNMTAGGRGMNLKAGAPQRRGCC